MRFHRIASTIHHDEAFHAMGQSGRRYTIVYNCDEGRWLLTIHRGVGASYQSTDLATEPFDGQEFGAVRRLLERAFAIEKALRDCWK